MRLQRLAVRNYRALEDVSLGLDELNGFFGPNGAGKSSFLDCLWFVRDCMIRDVPEAAADRDHGIGVLWDGAEDGASIQIEMETDSAIYTVELHLAQGRIDAQVGERLVAKSSGKELIARTSGSSKARFFHGELRQDLDVDLRRPEKLALDLYLSFSRETPEEAFEIDSLLRYVRFYAARTLDLWFLRRRGSESNHHLWLDERGRKLWSILRNLHDRRSYDDRYDRIVDYMREAFPGFRDFEIEQIGPSAVTCSFREAGRRNPIHASGVSDGHLQLLVLLTALFSEGRDRRSLVLFDEPETSLHPHALAVLAKAMREASENWQKQILVATHSPVLISQFDPNQIVEVSLGEHRQAIFRRVQEIEEVRDLLDEYPLGSLYMAEALAPQSAGAIAE